MKPERSIRPRGSTFQTEKEPEQRPSSGHQLDGFGGQHQGQCGWGGGRDGETGSDINMGHVPEGDALGPVTPNLAL